MIQAFYWVRWAGTNNFMVERKRAFQELKAI
jgi:hypothetical protein